MMIKSRLSIMMFAQYFAWGAWLVPLGSYMSKGLQFDDIIGTTFGLIGIATILSTLFVGMIADRYFAAQKVMALLCLGAGAALLWVSTITQSQTTFLLGCLLHFLFYSSTIPLATSIALHGVKDGTREFPAIRVWGTIGWIVGGLLIGLIPGAAETAMPMQISAIVYILLGLYAFTLPDAPPRARRAPLNVAGLFGLDIVPNHRDRTFWVFIVAMFVMMLPKSFYDAYANSFFVEKNLAITLFGARLEATAIQTAGQMFETLFLIALPVLLVRMGIKWVLVLGVSAWAARFVAFGWGYEGSQAVMPLLLFGIIIHGVCYDFVFVSSQIYIDRKFAATQRSRAQAFLALVTQGIGTVVGSNIAGAVYLANTVSPTDHDWRAIWLMPATVSLVAAMLIILAFRDKRRIVEPTDVDLTV
ncbi:MFS transporter [Sphingobium cupriresistens]|uniref:MFS transporter n=1 Tax=Sphingobium cupriresistens TaxID=1132417 RepID=UPI003BF4B20A